MISNSKQKISIGLDKLGVSVHSSEISLECRRKENRTNSFVICKTTVVLENNHISLFTHSDMKP